MKLDYQSLCSDLVHLHYHPGSLGSSRNMCNKQLNLKYVSKICKELHLVSWAQVQMKRHLIKLTLSPKKKSYQKSKISKFQKYYNNNNNNRPANEWLNTCFTMEVGTVLLTLFITNSSRQLLGKLMAHKIRGSPLALSCYITLLLRFIHHMIKPSIYNKKKYITRTSYKRPYQNHHSCAMMSPEYEILLPGKPHSLCVCFSTNPLQIVTIIYAQHWNSLLQSRNVRWITCGCSPQKTQWESTLATAVCYVSCSKTCIL